MLELIDLMELEVIVAPELGVASSHGVGGFQQVVTKVTVARFNHSGILCLKVPGLVLCPDKSGMWMPIWPLFSRGEMQNPLQ